MKFWLCVLGIVAAMGDLINIDDAEEFNVIIGKTTSVSLLSSDLPHLSWFLNLPDSSILKATNLNGEYILLSGLPGGIQIFEISCRDVCEDGEKVTLTFEYKGTWEAEPLDTKVIAARVVADPEL